jgi:hypothetical protein
MIGTQKKGYMTFFEINFVFTSFDAGQAGINTVTALHFSERQCFNNCEPTF